MKTRIIMALVIVLLIAGATFAQTVTFIGDDYNTKGDWKANPQPVANACAAGYGSYAHIQPYGGTETPWTPQSDEYWSDTTYGPVTYWTSGYYGVGQVGIHPMVTWNWGGWSVAKPADPRATWYEIGNGLGAHWYLACWDCNGEAHSWANSFMDMHLHFPYANGAKYQLSLWAYDKENYSRISQTYQFFMESDPLTMIASHRVTDEVDAAGNPTNPYNGNGVFYNGVISVFEVLAPQDGLDLIVRVYNDAGRFNAVTPNLNILLSAIFVDVCPTDYGKPVVDPIIAMVCPNGSTYEYNLLDYVQSAPEFGTLTIDVTDLPPNASYDPNTFILTWTPVAGDVGEYYPIISATNDYGTTLNSDSVFTVLPYSTPPVITLDPITAYYEVMANTTVTFTVGATDSEGDLITLGVDVLPVGASFPIPAPASPVSSVFSWTPGVDQVGEYTITFFADTFDVNPDDLCGGGTHAETPVVIKVKVTEYHGHGYTPGFWYNNARKAYENWTTGFQVPRADYLSILENVLAKYPVAAGWFSDCSTDQQKLYRCMFILSPSEFTKRITEQMKAKRFMLNLMLTGEYWVFYGEDFLGGNVTIGSVTHTTAEWLALAITAWDAGNYAEAFNITSYFSNDALFPF